MRAQFTATSEGANGGDHTWRSDCCCELATKPRSEVRSSESILHALLGRTCPVGEVYRHEGRRRLQTSPRDGGPGNPTRRKSWCKLGGQTQSRAPPSQLGQGRHRAWKRAQLTHQSPQNHHTAQNQCGSARQAMRRLAPMGQHPLRWHFQPW